MSLRCEGDDSALVRRAPAGAPKDRADARICPYKTPNDFTVEKPIPIRHGIFCELGLNSDSYYICFKI